MKKYIVKEYDNGGKFKTNRYYSVHSTLDEARDKVKKLIGVRRLTSRRFWIPDEDGAIEGYFLYPPNHLRNYGVGGYIIYEFDVKIPERNNTFRKD